MKTNEVYSQTTWWNGMRMFWREKQIMIAFHSNEPYKPNPDAGVAGVIDTLRLDALNSFLTMRGIQLSSFGPQQVARRTQSRDVGQQALEKPDAGTPETTNGHQSSPATGYNGENDDIIADLRKTTGKYLFPGPGGQGTLVVSYFNVDTLHTDYPMQEPESDYSDASITRRVVRLINSNLGQLRDDGKVPLLAAAPNWYSSGSPAGCTTTGGPGDPPCPVPSADECADRPGYWPITLQDLGASDLVHCDGEGVTIFVLDTMPGEVLADGQIPSQVTHAVTAAGAHNQLLQTLAAQMNTDTHPGTKPFVNVHYWELPPTMSGDTAYELGAGQDINGKPYGYAMPDHGLFVTGIVRDLASASTIEYMRVLDDFGVSTTDIIVARLEEIQQRIAPGGDLNGKPVVINLSLLIGPSDEQLPTLWFGKNALWNADQLGDLQRELESFKVPLHLVIQSLTANGAVVVAAAGNDSHRPQTSRRIGPRYPAAFPEVISVGAVDKQGNAASYSNYPTSLSQPNGIATYGGGIPTVNAFQNDQNVDALRGIYSSPRYPALDSTDPNPYYTVSNNHWAYWSGTSFATPIVSALAARTLQLTSGDVPAHLWAKHVQYLLTTADGQLELFKTVLNPQSELGVSMLLAEQGCQPVTSQPFAFAPAQETSQVG